MKKSILTGLTGVVLMVSGGHAQAEELNIVPHKGMTGGQEGMVSYGQREQGVFDVVADGRQRVEADEYIYSVTGECL